MSDLIDFDSPTSPTSARPLALPLIPSPESAPPDPSSSSRRSVENNPFDMVLKKITDYERNREDPFERVCEKAAGRRVSIEAKDDLISRRRSRHSDVLKLNKTLDETSESRLDDMSIITDLNDTNLIADNIATWDRKVVPELNVSPCGGADLSILNQSAMNDSLLDEQLTKEPSASLFARPRSMSQCNFFSPEKLAPPKSHRRSMSVTDATKSNVDGSVASAQSSLFEDPFNNAFRNSLKSSISSSVSGFNSQFDLSTSKQRAERLNSDSSVFSGLSNVSAITVDPATALSRFRRDRFGSETSNYSNISNLSIIPNNTVTSCDSSVFVDTMNKGFVTSRSQLSSTSSATSGKTPTKAVDTSDLIKKFYQIKSGMSVSQAGMKSNISVLACDSFVKPEVLSQDASLRKVGGNLIDVGNNTASVVTNDSNISDIIFNEARTLAETFEKMASSKGSYTAEDDLLFSKTQLNFDDLPPSDDEAVDNLIELSGGESQVKESLEVETKSSMSPKDEVKALEHEFIDNKDPDKKAAAATLLLDLEKLLKEQDNPAGFKVLTDLQKMLGVENNTEILQACLQNSMSPQKKPNSEVDSSRSVADHVESSHLMGKCSDAAKEISGNKSSSSNDITDLNLGNGSKDAISDNVHSRVEPKKEATEQNNRDTIAVDQKLTSSLLQSLNKIVSENDEGSAVDVLKTLGTILSMASELRTKNKPVPEEKESNKVKVPKQLNRSISSLSKSPSRKSLAVKKTQNASFETMPLRKSMSVNPAYGNSSSGLLEVPNANKRKSHLLSLKKRFPSDPGFAEAADKKKPEIAKSAGGANKSTVEPIKTKLKKSNSTVVSKRGPMKAIIPLGSMQKPGVKRESNEMGSVTPPSKATIPIKIVSSTPNSSANSKSKPTASSTPNGLKSLRVKPSPQSSSKGTCSLSPVSLNSSSKTGRKSEVSKSPRKAPSTPRRSEATESSRLPRYSPRPVRVRNYSFGDAKVAKTPQPASGGLKVASEKTQRHSSVLSPRNCNKPAPKVKPMSLMPKLSKSIGAGSKSGPEKENYV